MNVCDNVWVTHVECTVTHDVPYLAIWIVFLSSDTTRKGNTHCRKELSLIHILSRGVQKGIERASKVMMPLLFIIFVVIIGRSLSLPNAMEGVLYFLKPDFSKLTSAGLLYALGQSFFALSLGVTAMLTYASYLDKKTNLVQSGVSVVAMNISVSIMAGLAIFPAMSAFNIQSEGRCV